MKKTIFAFLALLLMCNAAVAQTPTKLPDPDPSLLKMSLGDALMQRRSGRSYDANHKLTPQQLSTLLWAACGVSDKASGKITAPSAVNMQDIKVYVCRQDGVWLYDAKANTLTMVTSTDIRPDLEAGQAFVKDAPVNLLLVSDQSGRRKNDTWGKMDSGYVSENIYLACTAMGMQTVARAMMNVDAVRKALNLSDGVDVLLNHPVGFLK